MGSMVDEGQMDRVLYYIDIGKKEGAKVAFGGERARKNTGGYYVEPTIFDGVKNSMRIAQEEIFGPVRRDHHLQGRRRGRADRQ